MPHFLNIKDDNFTTDWEKALRLRETHDDKIDATAAMIIAAVRERGDAALRDFSERFDGHRPEQFRLCDSALAAARAACPAAVRDALAYAAARIERAHRVQIPKPDEYIDAGGVHIRWVWKPVDSAVLYVPGGKARYPSSVLMNAIPAKLAGVPRLVMTTPQPGGHLDPAVATAAGIAGIDEIYCLGGAQAIAAFAFGTESIRPVAKIVGPANAYVSAAKRQVFGHVGIDMIAGPSEILVVADADNNPEWIAADLLSQAEHDEMAQAILITDNADFAAIVVAAINTQLPQLPRAAIAGASWRDYGIVILVDNLKEEAPSLIDQLAPEHVELCLADAENFAAQLNHAGAIFIGTHTPEALGDYVIGSNHVLPTARSARFSSGLGVTDFLKRIAILHCPKPAFANLAEYAITLAREEGLEAHARALLCRLGNDP